MKSSFIANVETMNIVFGNEQAQTLFQYQRITSHYTIYTEIDGKLFGLKFFFVNFKWLKFNYNEYYVLLWNCIVCSSFLPKGGLFLRNWFIIVFVKIKFCWCFSHWKPNGACICALNEISSYVRTRLQPNVAFSKLFHYAI